jgi:hypothetical protein
MDQIKFQEIVGEIEVLGEILIKNKSDWWLIESINHENI